MLHAILVSLHVLSQPAKDTSCLGEPVRFSLTLRTSSMRWANVKTRRAQQLTPFEGNVALIPPYFGKYLVVIAQPFPCHPRRLVG
jgi:hypothetical protein